MTDQSQEKASALEENQGLKFWWSDDEEIIRSEAFETREQAYSDAYCSRAQCFDDPSQSDGFYLHHGKMIANPDFDADYAKHYGFDEDNFEQLFEGKTERIEALTVTDYFHDQWVKALAPSHVAAQGDVLDYASEVEKAMSNLTPIDENNRVKSNFDYMENLANAHRRLKLLAERMRKHALPQPPQEE